MSPAVAEISAAITSAPKVPEGYFCMCRIILGGVVFAASLCRKHLRASYVLQGIAGCLNRCPARRFAKNRIFCVFFCTWIVANFEFEC
jgi:hypothetical protein